jgi:hypothetical protein
MPSRLMTGAILAFWLAMTALLIQREVVPMMVADASPTYQLDLTDEIGAPLIGWHIKRDGKRAGSATSRIIAKDDRSYEFQSTFHFDKAFLDVKQIESVDRINEDGKLQSLSVKFTFESGHDAEIRGEVVNHGMEPRLFINGEESMLLQWGKIDMTQQGSVTNTLSLLSRLRRLDEGQTFKVAGLDAFRGVTLPVGGDLIKQMSAPSSLIATVSLGKLTWNKREVSCYKIEYHEAGKDVTARTWVRKLDGMVLQQESSRLGFEMTVERIP